MDIAGEETAIILHEGTEIFSFPRIRKPASSGLVWGRWNLVQFLACY
jgi:hypothetical protein